VTSSSKNTFDQKTYLSKPQNKNPASFPGHQPLVSRLGFHFVPPGRILQLSIGTDQQDLGSFTDGE
jgi:hypothetical protein